MFSSAEMERMAAAQEAHMMDRCRIYPFERWEKDSFGARKKVFGKPIESICGLKMTLDQKDAKKDRYRAVEADAELRLPLAVEIEPLDEIEVTHRFGTVHTESHRYEVLKFESRGVSGRRVLLKEVVI